MKKEFSLGRVAAKLVLTVALLSMVTLPAICVYYNRQIAQLEKQVALKDSLYKSSVSTAQEMHENDVANMIKKDEDFEEYIEHFKQAVYTYLDFQTYLTEMSFEEWQIMRAEPETMLDNYGGYNEDPQHIDSVNEELDIILNMVNYLESEAYDGSLDFANE